MKNERGSITILVLTICLFVTIALIGIMVANKNKLTNQEKQQKIIEKQYNEDNRINEIYETTLKNH